MNIQENVLFVVKRSGIQAPIQLYTQNRKNQNVIRVVQKEDLVGMLE